MPSTVNIDMRILSDIRSRLWPTACRLGFVADAGSDVLRYADVLRQGTALSAGATLQPDTMLDLVYIAATAAPLNWLAANWRALRRGVPAVVYTRLGHTSAPAMIHAHAALRRLGYRLLLPCDGTYTEIEDIGWLPPSGMETAITAVSDRVIRLLLGSSESQLTSLNHLDRLNIRCAGVIHLPGATGSAPSGPTTDRLLVIAGTPGAETLRQILTRFGDIAALQTSATLYDRPDDASIAAIDTVCQTAGFQRVASVSRDDAASAELLFVRRPQITNSHIGKNGRFGNQLFQYMFLRCYAAESGFAFQNSPWAGDQLFAIQPGREALPVMSRQANDRETTDAQRRFIATSPLANVDVDGFFQFHTSFYRPYRKIIRDEMAPWNGPTKSASQVREWFASIPGRKIGIHLRRGDYGYSYFFIAPTSWYRAWLRDTIRGDEPITLFIASDDLDLVLPDFTDWPVLSSRDFPGTPDGPGYWLDFVALACCDQIAISNSSFSFVAAMLNDRLTCAVRPSLTAKGMIPFDPWDADVLLTDQEAEQHGGEFVAEKPGRFKRLSVRLRKSIGKRLAALARLS